MKLIEKVEKLVLAGYGRCRIERETGITQGQASKMIREIKEKHNITTLPGNAGKKYSKFSNEIEVEDLPTYEPKLSPRLTQIKELWEIGDQDTYSIGKMFKTSPVTTNNYIKKIEGTYDPSGDWVKKCAKYGVKYSFLKEKLSIKNLEKAKQVVKENFPECYVSIVKQGEDYLLTPIPDSAGEIEYLHVDVSRKKDLFTYYVSPAKNYMHVEYNDNLPGNEIEIWNYSDLHQGSKACREDLLQRSIKFTDSRQNSFFQLNGDMVENNSKFSAGSPNDQYLNPNEQVAHSIKTFMPYAYKTLNFQSGNHESRSMRFSEFDMGQIMADMLRLPYFTNGCIIDHTWRGITVRQFHTHRYGNAFTKPAIEAAVKKIQMQSSFPINIFSSGHSHDAFQWNYESSVLIPGRGFEPMDWWIINAGSFTQDTGTYSEKFGRSPKDLTGFKFNDNGEYEPLRLPIKSL